MLNIDQGLQVLSEVQHDDGQPKSVITARSVVRDILDHVDSDGLSCYTLELNVGGSFVSNSAHDSVFMHASTCSYAYLSEPRFFKGFIAQFK